MISAVFWLHQVDPFWPNCALVDPGCQLGDLIFCQRVAFRRHAYFLIIAADKPDQITSIGFLWNDGWLVVFTTVEGTGAQVEAQPRFLLLFPVAAIAVGFENRANIAHEVDRFGTEVPAYRECNGCDC